MEAGGDGQTYHHSRIASFPWPFDAGKRTVLTAALDLSVAQFAVSDDSKTVYFTAEAGTQLKLYSVAASGGEVRAHAGPASGDFGGLAIGGDAIVATYDSATHPAEIVQLDPEHGTYLTLTHFTDDRVGQLDLSPVEHFTFTSAKGRVIDNMIVKPPGFDPAKKYPLLVLMHGGPSPQFKDAWALRWNYQLLAAPGYVLVLTNYSGSSGYSEAFGQAIQLDPLKTPGDEINQGADEAIKRYPFIDATRQAAAGASYGGHLANWMEATTTRYKCIIAHAGLVNLETQWSTSDGIYHREINNGGPVWENNPIWHDQSPVSFAANHFKGTGWVTPILVTDGEQDFRVPMNNFTRELGLPPAPAGAEQADPVPGRQPLDHEGRGQPVLVRPGAGLAREVAEVSRSQSFSFFFLLLFRQGRGPERKDKIQEKDHGSQPGGQFICRPASTCTCR